ncbi:MAG: M48 family metallopeptidase [Candidatus Omnitrophica bacterium]|nr:M48 family metallopeptidase [Candidatus Omnitrophota bacterium]MDD5610223.1 M48 family metallopeptidase [Candidatus Omnitrophota bacterium]
MEEDLQIKAKRYSREKYILAAAGIFYSVLLLAWFQFYGGSKFLAMRLAEAVKGQYILVGLYVFILVIGYALLNSVLNFYRSFLLEHKFGLSTQNFKGWLADFLKGLIISCVIFLVLTQAFYFLLARFPLTWWLVVAGFWILFSVILARLTPTLLIPLFFKYKTLGDETLKARIMKLAGNMQVKVLDVFEIDFSKKTTKANAAFVGVGRTKRVILTDTLKNKYSYDEIEVILAHEFAHYRLKHLLKLILINSFFTLAMLYFIFKSSGYVFDFFSLGSLSDIANLPIVLLYMIIFNTVVSPWANAISRKFEKDADRLSLEFTGMRTAFISVMNKLAEQNLADISPNKWVKWFFFDHPPINERIEMAKGKNAE